MVRSTIIPALLSLVTTAACSSEERPLGGAEVPVSGPGAPLYDGGEAPVIDGQFDDWPDASLAMEDPVGDANGAFDVTRVHLTSRGTQLYVRFDTGRVLNLYNGPTEDKTLILGLGLPDGRKLSIDFRGRSAFVGGERLTWNQLGLIAAPNHAASEFEVRIDLGAPVLGTQASGARGAEPGDAVDVWLEGSDAVATHRAELSTRPSPVANKLDIRRPPNSQSNLRIASLNTRQALTETPEPVRRIVGVVGPDVLCLQELGSASPSTIADALLGAGDDEPWNIHTVPYGQYVQNGIASRHPIVPIPRSGVRFAGGIVLHPDGPIAVFSVHLKCCGYFRSAEDWTRYGEASALEDTILSLRAGELSDAVSAYANVPVVVVGDFNDVGTPQLEDVFTRPSLGLLRAPLRHADTGDVFTWSSGHENFPPSVLDLMLYKGLEMSGSVIVNSESMSDARLKTFGLEREDSLASDHLMLVGDFLLPTE